MGKRFFVESRRAGSVPDERHVRSKSTWSNTEAAAVGDRMALVMASLPSSWSARACEGNDDQKGEFVASDQKRIIIKINDFFNEFGTQFSFCCERGMTI